MCSAHGVANGYLDYRKMLERRDLDAVVVATPDGYHFEPARAVLEAGKHALVEKPFTTKAEADELIRLAPTRRENHPGGVQSPLAFRLPSGQGRPSPAARSGSRWPAMRARTTPSWSPPNTSPGPGRPLRLVPFFARYRPDALVAGFRARGGARLGRKEVLVARGIPTYDIIQAQVKFASGAFVTFESAWVYPNTFPTIVDSFMEVIGSAGHIHLDRKCESMRDEHQGEVLLSQGILEC